MVETAADTERNGKFDEGNRLARSQLLSGDLIIGLIGYAGAGCTDVYKRLNTFLEEDSFETHRIKLSDCIVEFSKVPTPDADKSNGKAQLDRAERLQDLRDKLRKQYHGEAVASLAIRRIREIRKKSSKKRRAIILDSLKHPAEVDLLRIVYERSFLLVGVYCGKEIRLTRLKGKFYGVNENSLKKFMKRDERDPESSLGQQVRKAFHQADFFLDNGVSTTEGHARKYDSDLQRFVKIMEGGSLIRPNAEETAMYSAYSAAQRSSCLSRQVGAAIANSEGEVISTGTNEVPSFGGGVYHDGHRKEENRCFKWKLWKREDVDNAQGLEKPCCHNTRKKMN